MEKGFSATDFIDYFKKGFSATDVIDYYKRLYGGDRHKAMLHFMRRSIRAYFGSAEEIPMITGDDPDLIEYKAGDQALRKASVWVCDCEQEMLAYFRAQPERMYTMTPRAFEELTAAIFRNNGFEVKLTPVTRDGGIDIVAVQRSVLTGDSFNLIECKLYKPQNRVGIGVVDRLIGVIAREHATKGIIVTTSSFTAPAKRIEDANKYILSLKDYHDIVGWLKALPLG